MVSDETQIAVAKVPNTNDSIVCSFKTYSTFFCADATNGSILFVQDVFGPLMLNICATPASFSAIAIERLFDSSPDIFVLVQSGIFRYDPIVKNVTLHCTLPPFTNKFSMVHAADIDSDGVAEVFYLNCVYSGLNCSKLWCASAALFNNAFGTSSAVGNLDLDPEGEVVFVGVGGSAVAHVAVYEHNGTLKWVNNVAAPAGGGPPTIADFNGDGIPDVGFANFAFYTVLDGLTGNLLKSVPVVDNSAFTASTSFDFQGDGASEMLYCDASNKCYIISLNWTITFPYTGLGTASESVAIADIDLDGTADIIMIGRLSVINSNDSWASARPAWTLHSHNSENIDQNSFPTVTTPSTIFRSNPINSYDARLYSAFITD